MQSLSVRISPLELPGTLNIPDGAGAVVAFAHGSGSSRLSPRNNYVADRLNKAGLATLLFDLLLEDEAHDRAKVFDISLLSERLAGAVDSLASDEATASMAIGLFGASTGAAAALAVAAMRPDLVKAVVSRGGRPDLAPQALPKVRAPTLLIVGGLDDVVIELNRRAYDRLACEKRLEIVPGATHLFEEPGKLDAVVELAADWFLKHLRS